MPIIRRANFDHSDTPVHWFLGNSWATHFSNAMQIIFPPGEHLFIRSVKAHMDKVTNPDLKKRVKGFIGQEVQHSQEHKKFWAVMEKQGLNVKQFADWFEKIAFGFIEPASIRLFGKVAPLSITAAAEHYTAIMAEMSFREDGISKMDKIPEQMQTMLLWHAAEEIEHKAVAFDVLQLVDDSELTKIIGMIVASGGLWFFVFAGMIHLMINDKEVTLEKALSDLPEFLFGQGQFAINILSRLFDYFKPGFHPDDHDTNQIVQDFLNSGRIPIKEKKSA